ncbi:MAG: Nif3-like dinuclear metal center hexameric protein [Candidatus Latescibacterota bacterium]
MAEKESISRDRLTGYLDTYLGVSSIRDDAYNGLQVEGAHKITKIAFSVDACLQTVQLAARANANMLIVHHGLLWAGHNQPITGIMKDRISILLRKQISLYASHLPLDSHDEVGNNVTLAKLLGMELLGKYASYKDVVIGVLAKPKKSLKRDELIQKLEKTLETRTVTLPFGPTAIRKVGIVSGDGAFAIADTMKQGADTFITGETDHVVYHLAKEAKVNMICAGHYASETVGVKALAKHIEDRFSIACQFISAPTGL